MAKSQPMSGPVALFRPKIRIPVSVTLTARHHRIVNDGVARTGLSRADFIGLLIELHGEHATIPPHLAPDDDEE